jgi:RNA-directed DNA polymerase
LKQLTYHLFTLKDDRRYRTFTIKKRTGGVREIRTPATALKLIQQKLNQVLQAAYNTRNPVHGFARDRSVVSNARVHLGAKFVLNIDLQDFFPSINFGRVRGMFIAKPYSITTDAATVLAQICCCNNSVPQGAPTSPIITNMVCARLDAELQRLAQRYNCLYTRYADDITFSTRTITFPKSLARTATTANGAETVIGAELGKIIEDNGFTLNPRKTRLQIKPQRQAVTGLTINEFPNVTRQYLNRVRAMLHAWEKYGLSLAEVEFRQRYDKKNRNPNHPPPSFKRVLKGKLDFITMVRGVDDSVCIRFLRKYAKLNPGFTFTAGVRARTNINLAKDAVWILEALSGEGDNLIFEQGTGFFLAGVGLVTCAHVLKPGLKAFRAGEPHRQYDTKLLAKDDDIDLAILDVSGIHHDIELIAGEPAFLQQSEPIRLLGFPNYAPGHECSLRNGEVIAFRPASGIRRIIIDANIITGNSGGPVLDKENRVIGVAAKGASAEPQAAGTDKHEVIPIDALKHLQPIASDDAERAQA